MSSDSMEKREALLEEFAREVRQFNGLGASFFRAAAARLGMNVTDLQVIDILDMTGPATAGQLAELMGLTTGAVTGMIDRLEKSALVHRERDPQDGRKVIVRLNPGENTLREMSPIFDSVGQAWDQIASRYDDEQLALLVDFLKQSSVLSREETARLRETPERRVGDYSTPLGDLESGHLIVSAGLAQLIVRAEAGITDLYRATFGGSPPTVKVEQGTVTIRYPQRLWLLDRSLRTAEIVLSTAIPWQIVIRGSGSELTAKLDSLDLLGLEAEGAGSTIRLELPAPSRAVPIQIGGSGSELNVRRPSGVPARVHMKGWGSEVVFDNQTIGGGMGSEARLQSTDYEGASRRYDIEVSGSGSSVTIASG